MGERGEGDVEDKVGEAICGAVWGGCQVVAWRWRYVAAARGCRLVCARSPLQHVLTRAEQAFSLSSALSLLSPAAICSTKSCCVPAAMVRLRLSCCMRQDAPPRWEKRETVEAAGGAVEAAERGVTA